MNYKLIEQWNGLALQTAATKRVISIGIDASPLNSYQGGIIQDAQSCSHVQTDHGVAIVGSGVENGVQFYLVRNSWGTGWGEQGYFRVLKQPTKEGKGCLALRETPSFAVVDTQ